MTELLVAAAFAASLFMGVSIGASSVSPAFGPVSSSGSSNVLRAALLGGFFAFLGAVLQGGNVAGTIGSGIAGAELTVLQGVVVLAVASLLVMASVVTDYPMPTAFTVTGAVIGTALGFGGSVNTGKVFLVAGYWLLVPIAAAVLGYVIAKLLRRFIPRQGEDKKLHALLLVAGSYMAYTAGAGSVGLAVGPLAATGVPLPSLLLLGGVAILFGSWLYSPRIINAVSRDYSHLGPRRAIAALGSSALLAQVGIFYGVPISFNEAIIASVIGAGMVESGSSTDRKKTVKTAAAWIGAFLLAVAAAFVAGWLVPA